MSDLLFVISRLVLDAGVGLFAARPKRINPKWLLVAFAVLAPLLGCQSRNTTVPNHLIGHWKTSAPRYANNSFEITKDSVIMKVGEETFSIRSISNIETVNGANANFNTFYLNQKGGEFRFSFHYDPRNNGEIRLKNPADIVYTKARR